MAVGSDAWKGLGVPLNGDFEIKQRTAATDIMTITGASGQSGDFVVCRNSAGAEKLAVDSSGNIVSAGTSITLATGSKINFSALATTAPSAGTAGQLYLLQASTAVQLGATNNSGDLVYFALSTTTGIS
jgi:hypothetical protein